MEREIIMAAICLTLVVLWRWNAHFRYVVKFVTYTLIFMLASILFIPLFIFRPRDIRNMAFFTTILPKFTAVFGIKYEIRRPSKMPDYDKPFVMLTNHQSIIDVIGMMEISPPRISPLGKKELIFAGSFGLAAWLAGMVFVDRSNSQKAQETLAQAAKTMIEKNIKVWIFPEGTRGSGKALLPFKKGAFHLAIQAQVPIFPTVFSSYQDFLSSEDKIFNRGKVIITCLPPVETTGLTTASVGELTDRVYAMMEKAFTETTAEVHLEAVRAGTSIRCPASSSSAGGKQTANSRCSICSAVSSSSQRGHHQGDGKLKDGSNGSCGVGDGESS